MLVATIVGIFFFFNDTATTEIYTLSLHDALPIFRSGGRMNRPTRPPIDGAALLDELLAALTRYVVLDRKSTRLNSSHSQISYAVFCLKKKPHANRSDIARGLPREPGLDHPVFALY